MFGVMTVHPAQRCMMETSPCWSGDVSNMMEVMSMMEGWNNGGWVMGPRGCSSRRRGRCCPYGAARPDWRSLGKGVALLLPDVLSLLVNGTESAKSSDENKNKRTHHQGNTQRGDDMRPEDSAGNGGDCDCSKKQGEEEEKETSVESAVKKDKKTWQYSVDVSGCGEVRAFTEHGMVTIEGRGRRGDSTMMVRHVTTLPAHVKPDTLTATLKKDGQLVLSHKCDTDTPVVPNIAITPADQHPLSEDLTLTQEKQGENQPQTTHVHLPTEEQSQTQQVDDLLSEKSEASTSNV